MTPFRNFSIYKDFGGYISKVNRIVNYPPLIEEEACRSNPMKS